MMQGQEEPPSVAQLRRLFYPSQADKHEEGKGRVPPLLPFSDEGQAERWAQADLESQLLLAQVVRQVILPWYARITQDRDFIVEIVIALRSALQVAAFRAASTSSGRSSSVLSLFVSEELPALLIQHYREYRRASDVYPSFRSPKGGPTATQVYLASNPHAALSVSRQGRLHVSEAYLDSLLQSLLEALLPAEQSSSEAQVAILRDVIKGSITNQFRVRGRGAWVLVRAIGQFMGRDLDSSSLSSSQASLSPPSQEHTVDVGSIATSLLHGLYALASMLMPLVVRSYLDLFTPNAELRRSSEAPARGSRLRQKRAAANGNNSGRSTSSKSSVVSILPTVHLAVEALELPKRALGSFVVWICQLSALWHLDQSIARRIEEQAVEFLTPNKVAGWIRLAREALVESQNQPPPPSAVEPPLLVQHREYDELVRLLSHRVSSEQHRCMPCPSVLLALLTTLATVYPPSHQILLGMTEDARRKSIKRALDPFLSPAPRRTSEAHVGDLIDLHDDDDDDDREQPSSLTEVAGTRLLLCVSERVLTMLDPSLAA